MKYLIVYMDGSAKQKEIISNIDMNEFNAGLSEIYKINNGKFFKLNSYGHFEQVKMIKNEG